MKRSIIKKYTVTFILLLACTILVFVAFFAFGLEKVYKQVRLKTLVKTYEMIDAAAQEGRLNSEDFRLELENEIVGSSMSVVVMDSTGEAITYVGGDSKMLTEQFFDILFGQNEGTVNLESADAYVIQESRDWRIDGRNMVLYGHLTNGNMVLLKTAVQSMSDSAELSTKFMIIIGMIMMLVVGVVIYFITRKITNPILELSELSKKMAELDFTVKYVPREDNEIDHLGEHMNELSAKLKATISELKKANNELKLDLDRKEQIDQMRTDFLSNVSHELKTPIALISGYAEGLKEGISDDPEDQAYYLDVIVDEADKMSRMVNKLLNLNQLEFGANEIEMEQFDITEMIREELNSMQIMTDSNDIKVEFNQKDPVYVWADQYKTEEVLTNYLSNAVHHIDGENIISVFLTQKEACVRISVFNTGSPIPEEDLERLWEKFYKVDKSHSRQYGGSGIGLSIVKAIMDAFHQDFGVINHENGVEFWFELDTKTDEEETNDSNC
jgi:two-component system, OmpR family, sensor histidine kinase VanS